MCLGIPALVQERDGEIGKVDFGGTMRQVNLSLVDARVGDYVIVHAGFAIQLLDEKDAKETLELFREIYGEQGGARGSGPGARVEESGAGTGGTARPLDPGPGHRHPDSAPGGTTGRRKAARDA